MFHRPPKKYSEYLVNVPQSIDWILKTLWRVRKGEGIVTKINAGTNISISPAEGTGDVTINATTLVPEPTGYGSFYSNVSQTLAAANTPQAVTLGQTYEAVGTSTSGSRIYLDKAGTYQFSYVAQVANSANSQEYAEFWIKYNGVVYPNSNTKMILQPRKSSTEPSEQLMTLIISGTSLNDNDYIELFWEATSTQVSLKYDAASGGYPATPSIIANIIPIGAQGRDSNLNELNDVLITSPSTGQLLRIDSDGLWKNWTPNFLTSVPTLAQVTTAGNTTTNAITVGGLVVDTNTLVVDSVNNRVGFGTTAPAYRADVQGLVATDAVRSHIGYDIYPVPNPTSLSGVVSAGGSVDTGLHGYYITFITALGETGGFGPISVTTTAGNNTVTLTIPVSSDPRVTGRIIYRTKVGSIYNEYSIATINNNTATTYVDTAADSTLTLQYRGAYYRANTTSNQITLSGQRAMLIDQNATYFGLRAGDSITSGGYSVFLGTRAGLNMTTGLSNIFVGYFSASSATTGDDNVIIGTTASFNATTLNRNVVLGTLAGRYHTGGSANITTMTDSIFIGMRSYAATATPANTIVIGYLAESLGDNTVVLGNSSIVRTALRGNVLVGTTTDAGYKLDVNGTARVQGTTTITPTAVTGSSATSALDISQTWNTTGTPIAFKLNVTDTASGNLSDLMQLQVGGVTRFRVLKSGFFTFNTGGEITGSVVIGGATINASSKLEVRSITQGFLPPRMTTTQKNAISTPASGLIVYDTTLNSLEVYNGTLWGPLITGVGTIAATSAIARGVYMNQTLVAAANNDVLVGLDINSTFTNGAFTGVQNVALRSTVGNVQLNTTSGNTLIGTTTDTGEKLQVNGVVRATSFSIGATAGWTGIINIMTNPPGQQNIDVQGGIIVNVF
jgi:hypothetical protein